MSNILCSKISTNKTKNKTKTITNIKNKET